MGSGEMLEPLSLFPCEKRGDVLIVGRYPEGETFGGTDRISYGAISKFRDFIDQEAPKHKHIFLEGDRFFRAKDIEWLLDNHNAKCYLLTVDEEEEKRIRGKELRTFIRLRYQSKRLCGWKYRFKHDCFREDIHRVSVLRGWCSV